MHSRRKREEEDNCIAFADWCRWNAHMIPALRQLIHIPNGGERPSFTNQDGERVSPEGARLKRMGVQAGVYDYLLAVPSFIEGVPKCGLWIEFKTKDGRESEEQRQFAARQEQFNYATVLVRSWTDGVYEVLKYLGREGYSGRPQ